MLRRRHFNPAAPGLLPAHPAPGLSTFIEPTGGARPLEAEAGAGRVAKAVGAEGRKWEVRGGGMGIWTRGRKGAQAAGTLAPFAHVARPSVCHTELLPHPRAFLTSLWPRWSFGSVNLPLSCPACGSPGSVERAHVSERSVLVPWGLERSPSPCLVEGGSWPLLSASS